jgi:hypothetical protein
MTALGDLLELLHSGARLSAFEGEFRDWSRPSPTARLVIYAEDADVHRLRWRGAGPFPQESEGRRRIWVAGHQLRVELRYGRQLRRLGLRRSDQWWRWDRITGTTTGSLVEHGLPPLLDLPLLSPARLIGGLRFEPTGSGIRLGREVVLARAHPRDPLPGSECVVDFEFDSERGVVLRRAVAENGHYVQITEAVEAHFDGEIDPKRFVFVEPDGAGPNR